MTEPQELRSIDELFRNTFNNLPDAPAENGWDVPSDKVWQHVRNNIQAPRSGWNWQSLLILSGFAVTVVLGLYLAFGPSKQNVTDEAVKTPVVTTAPVAPAPVAQVQTETLSSPVVAPVNHHRKAAHSTVSATALTAAPSPLPVAEPTPVKEPVLVQKPVLHEELETDTPPVPEKSQPRSTQAAPLPGTHSTYSPNTTEELKAVHKKQLEVLWNTPLEMLPVPRRITYK